MVYVNSLCILIHMQTLHEFKKIRNIFDTNIFLNQVCSSLGQFECE